ncbi:Vacuolar protein sorting protein [Entamoeba marina]
MVSEPHQYIPIIKVTLISPDISEDDLLSHCEEFGKIMKSVELQQTQRSYYIAFENVTQAQSAFFGLKKYKDIQTSRP